MSKNYALNTVKTFLEEDYPKLLSNQYTVEEWLDELDRRMLDDGVIDSEE